MKSLIKILAMCVVTLFTPTGRKIVLATAASVWYESVKSQPIITHNFNNCVAQKLAVGYVAVQNVSICDSRWFVKADTNHFEIMTPIFKLDSFNSARNDGDPEYLFHLSSTGVGRSSPKSALTLPWSQVTSAPSFLTAEVDPTVGAWIKSITAVDISHWDEAYSWGNHATAGYATASNSMTFTNKSGNISQWTNNAGYLTAEVDGDPANEIELPTQSGQSGKVLSTNGTSPSWITPSSGTVTSVATGTGLTGGPITGSGTISIANTGVSATTYGSATQVPVVAVNAQGQITSATNTAITYPGASNAAGYSSGTVYTLTTSSAKVDFGTTDPMVTIPAAGTYLILTNLKIEYAGVTTALNACSFKLRRTNNTAADLTNATTTFNVPVLTLATGTGGDVDIAAIIYTTSNNNDVIELWGNRSGGVTIGSINVGEASVVAIRIY